MENLIDPLQLRTELCQYLQSDYVALLGQRGNGSKCLINLITSNVSLGMKFIVVALPQGVPNREQFMEIFLNNLNEASRQIPPQQQVFNNVKQIIEKNAEFDVVIRLRMVLNFLGQNSTVSYLVIVLHALADVSEQPLKDLLQLLREYHGQRNNPGQGGEKLRFLVVGGVRLWNLCCHRPYDLESPFNIAKRVFIRGLSYEEINRKFNNIERAVQLRDLTDGVPSLVSIMSQETENFEDLSSCFEPLENNWNSLSFAARKALEGVADLSQTFPNFKLDYECPQIPKFEDSIIWQEAFWEGFLRIRHRKLTWRSPIHQAFVITQAQVEVEADISKSTLLKNSLIDRVECLENVLKGQLNTRAFDECTNELIYLAVHSGNIELVPLLEIMLHHQPREPILIKLEEIASYSSKSWIKNLSNLKAEPQPSFKRRLMETITAAIKQHFIMAIPENAAERYSNDFEQDLPGYNVVRGQTIQSNTIIGTQNNYGVSSSPPASTNAEALELWTEKLAAYRREEAIASDPEKKFQLKVLIKECLGKIEELGG